MTILAQKSVQNNIEAILIMQCLLINDKVYDDNLSIASL